MTTYTLAIKDANGKYLTEDVGTDPNVMLENVRPHRIFFEQIDPQDAVDFRSPLAIHFQVNRVWQPLDSDLSVGFWQAADVLVLIEGILERDALIETMEDAPRQAFKQVVSDRLSPFSSYPTPLPEMGNDVS